MKRRNAVLFFLLMLVACACFAPSKAKAGGSQLETEILAYIAKNVTPALNAQRVKLEAKLSPAEKTSVEGFRKQAKAIQAKRAKLPENASEAQREAVNKEALALKNKVLEMVKTKKTVMEPILKELDGQKTKWVQETYQIIQKHKKFDSKTPITHPLLRNRLTPFSFLLLNAAAPAESEAHNDVLPEDNVTDIRIEGKPSSGMVKLFYVVNTNDNMVSIDLYTASKKLIGNLVKNYHEFGEYNLTIMTASLPAGAYFYRIECKSGVITGKLNVTK